MKKSIIFIGLSFVGLLLFSGCASKPKVFYSKGMYLQKFKKQIPVARIRVANGAGTPSCGINETKTFENLLEIAADFTLKNGYKYFAIIKPDDISNINGSLRNTPEELLKYCSHSALNALDLGGTGLHICGTWNTQGRMMIAMFKKEQKNFTVIDAQNVINYFRQHGLYDSLNVDLIEKPFIQWVPLFN